MEQFVRDARIAMIYEGTNGIQALDLVGRKLPAFIEAHAADPDVGPLVQAYAKAFGALQLATAFIAQKSQGDPEEAAAAATDYLRLFGLIVALGFMWVRMAKVAADKLPLAGEDAAFYRAKRVTANFYIERILPQAGALLTAIKAGKSSMMALDEAAF
jgi:hypothetical protein